MSTAFSDPMSEELRSTLVEEFGDQVIIADERNALFNKALVDKQASMLEELSESHNNPVIIENNKIGDVKEMSDGTKYHVTSEGWKKV